MSAQRPSFSGPIPVEVQEQTIKLAHTLFTRCTFARSTADRAVFTEAWVSTRKEDGKQETGVVHEIFVADDMLNGFEGMHGGCAAYLLDMCTSVVLALHGLLHGKVVPPLSQALVTTFHAPAPRGAQLRIVSKTVSYGARIASASVEIWDVTNSRLCVTGTHTKMSPLERAQSKI